MGGAFRPDLGGWEQVCREGTERRRGGLAWMLRGRAEAQGQAQLAPGLGDRAAALPCPVPSDLLWALSEPCGG